MKTYTPEELWNIVRMIAPRPGLFLPAVPDAPSQAPAPAAPTPSVGVYQRYSDIVPAAKDVETLYWKKLRQSPIKDGVVALASINRLLSEYRAADQNVHREVNKRLLTAELMAKVASNAVPGPAFVCVFNRLGCLQLIRHLILYGNASLKLEGQRTTELGELALLSNNFLQFDPVPSSIPSTSLNLLVSFLPVWDVYNPRDLAYAVSRMYTILAEILPGNDPEVRRLVSKVGIRTSGMQVGKLPLFDFIATVFGLFAYGRRVESPDQVIFDTRRIFANIGFPAVILKKLVSDRALTTNAFRQRLSGGRSHTRKTFGEEVSRRSFMAEGLNIFRQYPLLKLDRNRVLILDLEFLAELLTSGVYWSIFDSLPSSRRETFRELWGRLFEIYVVDLLKQFYPQRSAILTPDLRYSGGQIDALLDFGNVVIVFEIKSSLLTETAKRSGRTAQFVPDYERKFVRNAKGAPKALLQLVASCTALENGSIPTAMRPMRIYPVCVSDDPAVESFFFNTYSNEIFQSELPKRTSIQPVTLMSINELEQILPYVSENSFSWGDLFDSRFDGTGVRPFSVHQAIFNFLRVKDLPPLRNQAIRKSFDEVWKIIRDRYKATAQ